MSCGIQEKELVGTGRFELPTPRTPSECSTRLSHVPTGRNSQTTIAANGVDSRILTSDGLPQLSRTGIRSFVRLIFIAAGFVTGEIRIRVRLQARRTRPRYKTPSGAVSPTRKLPFLS